MVGGRAQSSDLLSRTHITLANHAAARSRELSTISRPRSSAGCLLPCGKNQRRSSSALCRSFRPLLRHPVYGHPQCRAVHDPDEGGLRRRKNRGQWRPSRGPPGSTRWIASASAAPHPASLRRKDMTTNPAPTRRRRPNAGKMQECSNGSPRTSTMGRPTAQTHSLPARDPQLGGGDCGVEIPLYGPAVSHRDDDGQPARRAVFPRIFTQASSGRDKRTIHSEKSTNRPPASEAKGGGKFQDHRATTKYRPRTSAERQEPAFAPGRSPPRWVEAALVATGAGASRDGPPRNNAGPR